MRALVRPAARLDGLDWPEQVEIVRADLRVAQDLAAAFAGVDVLVHLAAAVTGGEDAQFAATVVGTERLLDAMALSQTRRLVLASSFSVYDWSAIRRYFDRGVAAGVGHGLYERDGYAIAKVWQERVVRRASDRARLATHGAPARLHLGAGQRLPGLPRPEIGPHAPGLRRFDPDPTDPRGQLRRPVRDGGRGSPGDRRRRSTWSMVTRFASGDYLGEYLRRSGTGGFRVPVPYGLALAGSPPGAVVKPADLPGQGEAPKPSRPLPVRGPLQAAPRSAIARRVRFWAGSRP